jgi:hypothetical protein
VPTLYAFGMLGLDLSSKTFTWILALQLSLSSPPGSALAALSGLITGYLYRTDTPFLLPSLTRPRRIWRPLKAYRIPLTLHNLHARIFAPLIGTSAPPRRANRVLPGQVRQAPEDSALTSLLTARGLAPPAAPQEAPAPPQAPAPAAASAAAAGTARARAAMGEWVSGGTRAPTEQEIAA